MPRRSRQTKPRAAVRPQLDDLDRRLLAHLQDDARITSVELARRLKLSAPGLQKRVRKLEQLGVIKGYAALFELAHAFLEAGGRQLQPARQLHAGDTRIVLQVRQQPDVQVVQLRPFGDIEPSCAAGPYRHTEKIVLIHNYFKPFG